jgi:hypothetical protein
LKGWIILVTSIILVIALIDNSLLIGQAFNSTKILPPNNSEDLTSQDRVLIKLTPSGTSAQGDVSPKNIKVKVGTTVVWQNMLPEKVYVQSKPDENHYEGDYKNVLKSVIFTNVELTVTDPKITKKPSFLSNARIEDSPIIPSTLNETLIDPKPTNATIKLNSTENKEAEDLALQTTLDNNTEDLALQTTLDNNTEDLALQTTLDNNTEDLALQTDAN